MANNVKKSNVVKTTSKVENKTSVEKEIEELKQMMKVMAEQNEMLRKQNQELMESKNSTTTIYADTNSTRNIKVISLCPYEMNLSQYEHGEGKIYKFPKLGTVKTIPANILSDVVSTHLSLAEKGFFYICDEEFVRDNGLESEYENLVKADVIDSILEQDKDVIKEALNTCSVSQLDIILETIIGKISSDSIKLEELEENGKISLIERIYEKRTNVKCDIADRVADIKYLTNKE